MFFGTIPNYLIFFVILPIISYGLGFLLNLLSQYVACSKINFPQIALNSIFGPLFVFMALFLLYIIPSLENPIRTILPFSVEEPFRKGLSQSFYIFWAGLYGQAIATGFLQTC